MQMVMKKKIKAKLEHGILMTANYKCFNQGRG